MNDQVTQGGENTKLIVLISVVATIGGFLFGFDSGVINGTQEGLEARLVLVLPPTPNARPTPTSSVKSTPVPRPRPRTA